MMKKIFPLLFVVLCMAMCVIPSLGMTFHATNERIGNETETPFPSIRTEEGGFNSGYLPDLGSYFEKHFAFRPQMIDTDARVQSTLFGVSDLDTVAVGGDDWLYYTATLDDFLGRNTLSRREINGIVHNLGLVQEYVESQGSQFLFTVAPNKNTLYPDSMPYYYGKAASDEHNRDLLNAALADSGVNYLDLFELFRSQDETLYFKQDSHWNNKGARMVYNAALDALKKRHDDYGSVEEKRVKDHQGDLAKMLYPASQLTEYDYQYDIGESYAYVTPTKSVEDARIVTENPSASGSLYMYRDSFGNSLLPFFASAYQSATFTKSKPINVALDNRNGMADTVIFEIVERNVSWFLESPPVIPSPKRVLNIGETVEGKAQVSGKILEANTQLIALTASVDSSLCADDAVLYMRVKTSDGKSDDYEAFAQLSDENGDNFVVYLPAADYAGRESEVDLIVGSDGGFTKVYHTSVDKIDPIK
ncbi:MAG: hypothetical protein IJG87_01995 [Ruminococcus sp.]|nr:hypothetical protein [Ruminococcus sp.]